MITGHVVHDEAFLRLKVTGPTGRHTTVTVIIDTGYNQSLTLSRDVIEALELKWESDGAGELADGSEIEYDRFTAMLEWGGQIRRITVDESEGDPIIGMKLLRHHELKMDCRHRGKVTIKPLRSSR